MQSCIEDWAKQQGIQVGAVKCLENSELRGIQAASSISPGDLMFSVPMSSAILLSTGLKRCVTLGPWMILGELLPAFFLNRIQDFLGPFAWCQMLRVCSVHSLLWGSWNNIAPGLNACIFRCPCWQKLNRRIFIPTFVFVVRAQCETCELYKNRSKIPHEARISCVCVHTYVNMIVHAAHTRLKSNASCVFVVCL